MAAEYSTRQGDTFESIAWEQLGDSGRMTEIIGMNRQYFETAVFPAGVVLRLPETEKNKTEDQTAPWRRRS